MWLCLGYSVGLGDLDSLYLYSKSSYSVAHLSIYLWQSNYPQPSGTNYNYCIAGHDFMRLRSISGLTWSFSCWMLLAAGVLQNSPDGWSIMVERFKMNSFMLLSPWPKYLRRCFYLGDFFPFVKALRNSLRDQRLFIGQGNWISFLTAQGCKRLGPVCLSSYQPGSEAASCSLLTKSLMSQPDSVGWAASTGL